MLALTRNLNLSTLQSYVKAWISTTSPDNPLVTCQKDSGKSVQVPRLPDIHDPDDQSSRG